MPEPRAGINQGRHRPFPNDLRPRLQVQPAFAIPRLVGHQHRDAVRVDPEQVSLHHHLSGCLGKVRRHAPFVQDRQNLRPHTLRRDHQHAADSGAQAPNTREEARSTTSQLPVAASRRSRSCAAAIESGTPIGAGGGAPAAPSWRNTSVL